MRNPRGKTKERVVTTRVARDPKRRKVDQVKTKVEERIKKELREGFGKQNPRRRVNLERTMKDQTDLMAGSKETRKEREMARTGRLNESRRTITKDANGIEEARRKKRQGRLKPRTELVSQIQKEAQEDQGKKKRGKKVEVDTWSEQVVRVGTGYRVRQDEKDPRKRRFDVGYADRKEYKRGEGREVTVDQTNRGRTVRGKGKDARVKVMNAVARMEKRRPTSEYTGSGIMRKSLVGKQKLKSTKSGGKE